MNDILQMLVDAINNHDILTIVVGSVVVILTLLSVTLGALGKKVPLITPLLELAKSLLSSLPKKSPPPPPPGEAEGVAKVVPIEDVKKGPPAP